MQLTDEDESLEKKAQREKMKLESEALNTLVMGLGYSLVKAERYIERLGAESILQLAQRSQEQLENSIGEASNYIQQCKRQLVESDSYQKVRDDLRLLTSANRELYKSQEMMQKICLDILLEKAND